MIFLKITGGLGNQMFQYATAYALAKKNKTNIGIDLSEINKKEGKENFTYRDFQLNSIFNISNYQLIPTHRYSFIINHSFFNKIKRKLIGGTYFLEKNLTYQKDINLCKKNSYIEGYFQSEKYFIEFENEIRNQFNFKGKFNLKTNVLAVKIKQSPSLAIHIRRGDYINNKIINQTHGTCNLHYYKKALSLFDLKKHHLYFFSDDINWVKNNFNFIDLNNATFVDWNKGDNSWQDMYLMSLCENFIIANSSFSWWGAWLSVNKNKKVIAPKKWFADKIKNEQTKDLFPTSWIKI